MKKKNKKKRPTKIDTTLKNLLEFWKKLFKAHKTQMIEWAVVTCLSVMRILY